MLKEVPKLMRSLLEPNTITSAYRPPKTAQDASDIYPGSEPSVQCALRGISVSAWKQFRINYNPDSSAVVAVTALHYRLDVL